MVDRHAVLFHHFFDVPVTQWVGRIPTDANQDHIDGKAHPLKLGSEVQWNGKRGELRQHYREGQEDQLGTLGLMLNMIVLWNTSYMEAALTQLRADGFEVRDEDVARLSPLLHEHINMLGRYSFSVPDAVAKGELRPLRNPASDR